MEFDKLVEARYSCRKFSDKKVDPALIEEIIAVGNQAPTAVNKQPFKIFRMESAQAKEAIRATTRFHFDADNFLVVGYPKDQGWVRRSDSRPFADVDASIVGTYMMLKITDLGLGTTWVGYFDAPRLKELCPALADYDLIAIFPIGYPAEDAAPAEYHYVRKPIAEIAETL